MTALDERRPSTALGATVWLTGLPSAGKTTLATALAERLRARASTGWSCSTATRCASS